MDSKRIRGIGCLLRNDTIYPFLRFITQKRYACFAPWCLKSDNTNPLPQPTKNIEITDQTIQDLEDQGLWELVLHIYPYNVEHITIETYEDFMTSNCHCCIIYYDCGFLNVYVKKPILFQQIWEELSLLKAENMTVITDDNDGRVILYP